MSRSSGVSKSLKFPGPWGAACIISAEWYSCLEWRLFGILFLEASRLQSRSTMTLINYQPQSGDTPA